MAGQGAVVAAANLDDAIAKRCAVEQAEDVVALPSSLADDQQPRGSHPVGIEKIPPDGEQQGMVLARLDRAEDDESRPPVRTGRRWHRLARVATQMCGDRRAFRKILAAPELLERVQGRLAVADDPGGGRKHRAHPQAMPLGFARAAQLRVRDRNEIVHHVDRPQALGADPARKARVVKPSVADIEVKPSLAAAAATGNGKRAGKRGDQGRTDIAVVGQQNVEQPVRRAFRKYPAGPDTLDDGLAVVTELFEIGEAHPVDAGREPATPPAPDETRYVHEILAVVGHPGGSVRSR